MTDIQKNPDELTILSLDTCTESCSAALSVKGQIFSELAVVPREHSQRILPMVDSVLSQANISLSDVDLIAYGRGPGSFTGIRICTSMTQGLALGQDIPVIGLSALQTMAQTVFDHQGAVQVICAIDARMGEIYWGQFVFNNGLAELVGLETVTAPNLATLELDKSLSIIACGTGFETYPQLLELCENITLTQEIQFPDAKSMLSLAKAGYTQGLSTSVDDLAPVYVRDTVTWKKLPGRE
ncbi:tRNA (adenosine(37)-N6)-threonylcarbamoyltransferase complex dimerization subunit type 1 TsaB [Shewanella hanedai]|uniref:tRNA threonylcarbamoyladenosine biosynthesis protein TsaB n=1 Tax=Shewanella hanedai TaxID=25 RepID=A0A553JS37_SHEHA|nr:tRNA (adenosine(37)-N6)-threonylcarbamoyltransferase complex dimerization subunit type 1 TsaB [Shewanella hanedai]TRY15276.1 tRNA (adenosine(37)-N6)-threonylcarbamoyltransferase complex dimerization subunit type 1 TsaB [Shewanella hanedai]GGI73270.1 tRNA (adenosine(37)-N6)-threonylcarbamoyltransferase complex dimerization subunit type 1 TsaB [Shewanella hanedai]